MRDNLQRRMQHIDLGADETSIALPHAVRAQAVRSNCFSIIGAMIKEPLNIVLQRGPWSFGEWMIVTHPWDTAVTEENLKMIALWVHIKEIALQCPHHRR
ncbi:hypothetical protein YC2023_023371 [Brassica napus]